MSEAKNESSEASIERLFMRFERLRKDLFGAIKHSLENDGHCKHYEGRLSWIWPNYFSGEYSIELACYVIGPSRGDTWSGKSIEECLDKAEKDIRRWIAEEYAHDYDALLSSRRQNNERA